MSILACLWEEESKVGEGLAAKMYGRGVKSGGNAPVQVLLGDPQIDVLDLNLHIVGESKGEAMLGMVQVAVSIGSQGVAKATMGDGKGRIRWDVKHL